MRFFDGLRCGLCNQIRVTDPSFFVLIRVSHNFGSACTHSRDLRICTPQGSKRESRSPTTVPVNLNVTWRVRIATALEHERACGLSMIARGTGGEFSVRGGCRVCVMGVLFAVLSHHVVEVYLPALPRSIAAPPSNSCERSVQCAPPGLRFGGCSFRSCAYLELSKVPACHSSKTVKGRSYQRSLETTHTYRSECRNNNIP